MTGSNDMLRGRPEDRGSHVLGRVNGPAAPTWNRLGVNGLDLAVPAVQGGGAAEGLPRRADGGPIAGGTGGEAAAWLARAAAAAGAVRTVAVPDGVAAEPVLVDLSEVAGDLPVADVLVEAGASSSVRIVLVAGLDAPAAAPGDVVSTCGWKVRVRAGSDARVELVSVVAAAGWRCIDDVGIELGDGARATVRQFYLDADETVAGLACELAGDRSRLGLEARYAADGARTLDFNYAVRHRGRASASDLSFVGVLAGGASKTLRDAIDFERGCKGSAGRELERVVLVGDGVRSASLPTILCAEDDVAGDHGATAGEIDPSQLAYLASRGLDDGEVRALLMGSVFEAAREGVPEGPARRAAERAWARVSGEEACHGTDR